FAAEDLAGFVPEQTPGRLVERHDAAVPVDRDDPVEEIVQDRMGLAAVSPRAGRAAPPRFIGLQHAGEGAVFEAGRDGGAESARNLTAIGMEEMLFRLEFVDFAGEEPTGVRLHELLVVRIDDRSQRRAQELLSRIAQQRAEPGVDLKEASFGADQRQADGSILVRSASPPAPRTRLHPGLLLHPTSDVRMRYSPAARPPQFGRFMNPRSGPS